MFAKVFRQIFDSSIAENYSVRRMFMDLLVLADRDGTVDMTMEAIGRVTNVPIEEVRESISALEREDPLSRSPIENGRRLVRIDEHRSWGWKIVNYEAYREIRDEEARREYFRDRKREQRERERLSDLPQSNQVKDSQECPQNDSISVSASSLFSGLGSGEGADKKPKNLKSKPENYEELKVYVVEHLALQENDAAWLWDKWKGNGFRVSGKLMSSWKHTASSWERSGYFPSQKPEPQKKF